MPDSSTQRVNIEKKYCPKCYQQYEGAIAVCPDDGTTLRGPNNDPLIGTLFADKYEMLSVLGLGGMSIVYKAKHRLMERTVAVKMLHQCLKEDVLALERFKLEATAVGALAHQNVITVYDFGVTPDGEPYFVMDCLEGENLKELIDRKGKVPYERALPIFRQICDGLDAAHKKLIVHRDLKPANVVLIKQDDGSEIVKLVDFGIAKLLPGSGKNQQHLTQTGEVFGSPIYMSPEQCLGRELDTRSDIYALGCLMYETLAGEPPFLGDSFLETMNKHVSEKPKPFKQMAPDLIVPPAVEQIIFRCMSKDPADRFQTAGEIRDSIAGIAQRLLGGTGKQAGFISGVAPPAAECRRRSYVWRSVTGVLGCALVGFAGFMAFWPGPADDPGTLLNKMRWQINLSELSTRTQSGDYAGAESAGRTAEALASQFGDGKMRLHQTYEAEAVLYNKWEGHAEELEKVNSEMSAIQVERLKTDFRDKMAILEALARPTTSAVTETNKKLKAEAQLPAILSTLTRLHGRGLFEDEEQLGTKALSLESKLLGSDTTSLAPLQTELADCLIQERKFPKVRPLLVAAGDLRKKQEADHPAEYVQALSKLGQFDLDQNDFQNGEPELANALKEARKLPDKHLLVLVMRSYANLLTQCHNDKKSQELLREADTVEGRAH